MGAAADFEAEGAGGGIGGVVIGVGYADDADDVAVAVAEEGEGAVAHGVGIGGFAGGDGEVGAHLVVGEALHGQLLVGGHWAHMAEVEAQAVGGAEGAGLADMGAEHGAEGGVEQVGCAVVAGGVQAAFRGDLGGDGVAQHNIAGGDGAPVDDEAGDGALGVVDLHLPVGAGDDAAVAYLAAAFGVEAGGGEDDFDLLALGGVSGGGAVAEDADDAGFPGGLPVAVEGGVAGAEVFVGGDDCHIAGGGAAGAVAFSLGVHCGVEFIHIDGQAVFPPADFVHQFRGEAVGVVEEEGLRAGDGAGGGGLQVVEGVFQYGHSVADVVEELVFLQADDAADEVGVFGEGGVGGGEAGDDGGGDGVHIGLVHPELASVADGAADDAAEYIAALAVGGDDAVADEEGGGAGVFGNDADGVVGGGGGAVFLAGELADGGDDGLEEVGFIDIGLVLEHGGGAFQAHSGVHAGGGQGGADAVRVLVELHKDEVPEFDEAGAFAVGVAAAGLGGGAAFGLPAEHCG